MDRGWLRGVWDLIEQAAAHAAKYLVGNKKPGPEEGQGLLVAIPVFEERSPLVRKDDLR